MAVVAVVAARAMRDVAIVAMGENEAGREELVGVVLRRWGVAARWRVSLKETASNSYRSRWSRSCDDESDAVVGSGAMGNSVGGGGGGGCQGEEDRCNRGNG